MKASKIEVAHVAIQLRVAEARKDYEKPVYLYIDRSLVNAFVQLLADVVGREVRVTFPETADLAEVQRKSGKYFTPKLLVV